MIIYDYYEQKKYNEITDKCSEEIKKREPIEDQIDAFRVLLKYYEKDEIFNHEYPIDNNGCLFYLMCKYATSKKDRLKLKNLPQIKNFKLEKKNNIICSTLGKSKFKLYLKNPLDILSKYIETDVDSIEVLKKLYDGKLYHYCHYTSVKLCKNHNIVSAFIPSKFKDYVFLHSFLEKEDTVYDVSNNLVMSKDDYYSLLTPEIIVNMSGEELYNLHTEKEASLVNLYLDYVESKLDSKKLKR